MSFAEMAEVMSGRPSFFSMRNFGEKAVSPPLGSQKLSSSSARGSGMLLAGGCDFSKYLEGKAAVTHLNKISCS